MNRGSKNDKSQKFRSAVKLIQNETVFLKPIINKSTAVDNSDDNVVTVNSEVVTERQPQTHPNPSNVHLHDNHQLFSRHRYTTAKCSKVWNQSLVENLMDEGEQEEENVSKFLTKVEVHSEWETKV